MAINPTIFLNAQKAADLARDYQIVFTEINAIEQAVLTAVSQCTTEGGQLSVIVKDTTPMTFVSRVTAVDVTAGGADYYPVVATATFFHPLVSDDGVGNDATANVIVANAAVNNFVITDPGDNYATIIAQADATGTGDGLATVILTVQEGIIISATVVAGGTLYLVDETIPVVHPSGVGADLTVASVGAGGNLLNVRINDGGTGYEPVTASVQIDHPSGLGFDGIVQIDAGNQIIGVSIQNGGSGYMPLLPIISITDPNLIGSGAIVTVTTDTITGELLSAEILDGGANYPADTTGEVIAALTSSGAGATVDVTVALNTFGTDPKAYYDVLFHQITNTKIRDEIDYVIGYFLKLGYSIEAQPNPQTLATLQWHLIW